MAFPFSRLCVSLSTPSRKPDGTLMGTGAVRMQAALARLATTLPSK